jgi:hypothetical protein
MGASFDWTFNQAFAGNVAPDAETTGVTVDGVAVHTATRDRAAYAESSPQETRTTEVEPNG